MRILLWDIDGTLVNTGGVGMKALADAVGARPAAADTLRRMRLDGMTDRTIARTLCAAHAHSGDPSRSLDEHAAEVTDAEIDRVLAHYIECLREGMRGPLEYKVLDGVFDALDAVESREDVVLALGTGNIEEGARLKLEHANLWQRFHFGGFGSDAEARPDILRAAWKKAEAHLGRACSVDEFVVIGDTPRDVVAAHAVGMRCVGVASGRHSINELVVAGADAVLPSLTAPNAVPIILDTKRGS